MSDRKYGRRAFIGRVVVIMAALAVTAAASVSCLSPTMPMPPPSRPEIDGPDERGVVVLSGRVPADSYVYADNLSTGYGYSRHADVDTGSYRLSILASVGDNISLFYRLDTEDSMAVEFRIPKRNFIPNNSSGGTSSGGTSSGGTSPTPPTDNITTAGSGSGGAAGSGS